MSYALKTLWHFRVSGCVHITSWLWSKLWTLLETKVFKRKLFGGHGWGKGTSETPKKIGLEENITLPSTGWCWFKLD